ncbi:MAG: TlyA family RNA methyltransferase [Alphaproteobacteria bacterium]
MATKIRLDALLVERGLAQNRTRAQALIISGSVFSDEVRLDKPGHQVKLETKLEVRGAKKKFVSRGGEKLAHAIAHFGFSVLGERCLDIGASTGGFTDVLLKAGASHVTSVDVGRGQLAWELRNDERVLVLEGFNARYLTKEQVAIPPKFIVCDASFIGLEKVLPAALDLAAPRGVLVALIKPQFEVGKGRVGKGGVVKDPDLHRQVCENVTTWLEREMDWEVKGITESPLKGPKGNKEFLIYACKRADVR